VSRRTDDGPGTTVRVNVVCSAAVRPPMLDRPVPEDLPEPSAPEAVGPAR